MIIVLDIGSSFTKCGFAGKTVPHSIVETPLIILKSLLGDSSNVVLLQQTLRNFLHNIFFSSLLVDPSYKAGLIQKVVILENVLMAPTFFKKSLACVLSQIFWIDNIIFVPTCIASTYCLHFEDDLLFSFKNENENEHLNFESVFCLNEPRLLNKLLGTERFDSKFDHIQHNTNRDCLLTVDCGYSQISIVPICSGLPLITCAFDCPEYRCDILTNPSIGEPSDITLDRTLFKVTGFRALVLNLQGVLLHIYHEEPLIRPPNLPTITQNIQLNYPELIINTNTDESGILNEGTIDETNFIGSKEDTSQQDSAAVLLETLKNHQKQKNSVETLELFQNIRYVEDLAARICCVSSLRNSTMYDYLYLNFAFPTNVDIVSDQDLNQIDDESNIPCDIPLDGLCTITEKPMIIPGWIRQALPEMYFRPNQDGETLPTLMLDSISKCPIDCRKALTRNMVLVGGLSMLPGFSVRLKEEIERIVQFCPDYNQRPYLKMIHFHSFYLTCPKNLHQHSKTFTEPAQEAISLVTDPMKDETSKEENSLILKKDRNIRYVEFVKPNYAAWTGASILFAAFYTIANPSNLGLGLGLPNLTSQTGSNIGIDASRSSKNSSTYRTKLMAMLNTRRGMLSKFMARDEFTKIFGTSPLHSSKYPSSANYLNATGNRLNNGVSNLPTTTLEIFDIKFPHTQESTLYLTNLKNNNSSTMEGGDSAKFMNQSTAEDSKRDVNECMLLPDWDVIDPMVRPYGFILHKNCSSSRLPPFML